VSRRATAVAVGVVVVAVAVAVALVLTGRDGWDRDEDPTDRAVGAGRTAAAPVGGGTARPIDLGKGLLSVPNEAKAWVDRQQGQADPAVVERIASQPDSLWLLGDPVAHRLGIELVQLARQQERTVAFTLYNVPQRDDGLSGPRGATDADEYAAWVDEISAMIGDTRAIVVVEPDALWFVDRQTPRGAARTERMDSLRYAVTTLGQRNPRTRVYVEAGTASGSVEPDRMAELLAEVGVGDAVGFAVNVSSYSPDREITDYAHAIRDALIAEHDATDPRYVVDTSRNGNPEWDFEWCNPPGRLLGHAPGLVADPDGLDLNLWVKAPASSDGDCGIAPGSYGGQFLPDEAIRMSHDRP
jgi:endoglucanase